MSRITFKVQLAAAIGTSLLVLGYVGVLTYTKVQQENINEKWVEHTHAVIDHLSATLSHVLDQELHQHGAIITGNLNSVAPVGSATKRQVEDIETLKQLTADNPTQQATLSRLEPLLKAH